MGRSTSRRLRPLRRPWNGRYSPGSLVPGPLWFTVSVAVLMLGSSELLPTSPGSTPGSIGTAPPTMHREAQDLAPVTDQSGAASVTPVLSLTRGAPPLSVLGRLTGYPEPPSSAAPRPSPAPRGTLSSEPTGGPTTLSRGALATGGVPVESVLVPAARAPSHPPTSF